MSCLALSFLLLFLKKLFSFSNCIWSHLSKLKLLDRVAQRQLNHFVMLMLCLEMNELKTFLFPLSDSNSINVDLLLKKHVSSPNRPLTSPPPTMGEITGATAEVKAYVQSHLWGSCEKWNLLTTTRNCSPSTDLWRPKKDLTRPALPCY